MLVAGNLLPGGRVWTLQTLHAANHRIWKLPKARRAKKLLMNTNMNMIIYIQVNSKRMISFHNWWDHSHVLFATEVLDVLNLTVISTQCGHPVSHGTHQVDNLIAATLSPASLPLGLLPLWWSVAIIPEDHVAGVAYKQCPSNTYSRERSCTGLFLNKRMKLYNSFWIVL